AGLRAGARRGSSRRPDPPPRRPPPHPPPPTPLRFARPTRPATAGPAARPSPLGTAAHSSPPPPPPPAIRLERPAGQWIRRHHEDPVTDLVGNVDHAKIPPGLGLADRLTRVAGRRAILARAGQDPLHLGLSDPVI